MRDGERLEALQEAVGDLADANTAAPVLVEGERDVAALRALGLDGELMTVHRGASLVQVADDVARSHRSVIILTDWDRKGGLLARRLADLLVGLGVKVDVDLRRRLARLARGEVRTVEALPALLSNAARRADPGGPGEPPRAPP